MLKDQDRGKKILAKLEVDQLPFALNSTNIREFGKDLAQDLNYFFTGIESTALKWCMSTVKKAKVFTIIYHANENGKQIYKEEVSKKIPEYSYKTIASIIDEGTERGYYIALDPMDNKVVDKKIKNIRPSEEVVIAFLNYNIKRIITISKLIKKYKKK